MFVVSLVAFYLFQFLGDPVNQLVGQETSLEDRNAIRESLGLNKSYFAQYQIFLFKLLQFDFGISYQFKVPVSELILSRLPATLELALVSFFLALIIAIPLGVFTALYRQSNLSKIILSVSLLGLSLPTFLIGILLIYIFSVMLQILPSYGRGDVITLGWWSTGLFTSSGLKALILPSITLSLFQINFILRLVRSEMLEVLQTDYIKFAIARGLSFRVVYFKHALKNTLIPVITIAGLQLGSIIAFAIVTETVFQWPGMGQLFIHAIQNADFPIVSAYLLLISLLFIVINQIVDGLYYYIDPRIRFSKHQQGGVV